MSKIIRISDANEAAIKKLLDDSKNDLLTEGKAVNIAIEKGVPVARKLFVKPAKK